MEKKRKESQENLSLALSQQFDLAAGYKTWCLQ